jgi:hypothetical protein
MKRVVSLCLATVLLVSLPVAASAQEKKAKVKTPNVTAEVNAPEIKAPEVKAPEVKAPEVKVPEVKVPEVKVPEVKVPEVPKPSAAVDDLKTQVESAGYGKPKGLIGDLPLTVGPKVSLGLPMPTAVGLEAKYANLIGASFDYNYFPSLTLSSTKISANGFAGSVRIFPWRQAMFIGVGFQKQTLSLTRTETVSIANVATAVTVSANDIGATYIVPHIGWRWTWDSGFWWGMELGWQQPLSTSGELTVSPSNALTEAAIADTKKTVGDLRDLLGKQGMPRMGLIQFGFLF